MNKQLARLKICEATIEVSARQLLPGFHKDYPLPRPCRAGSDRVLLSLQGPSSWSDQLMIAGVASPTVGCVALGLCVIVSCDPLAPSKQRGRGGDVH